MGSSDLSTLAKTLQRHLPQASKRHLLHFISTISKTDTELSQDVISDLLTDGCDPNSIHTAILFGRDQVIEKLTVSGGLASISNVIYRFDRMVSMLMHILVGQLQTRLQTTRTQLLSTEQETLLAKAAIHWIHEGEIDLYNYFMEMPIKALAVVRDAHENTLTVERSHELIWAMAAGEHGRFITTALPGSDLVLMLEAVSSFHNKINFKHAGIFRQVREKRRHFRVQPDPLLPLTVVVNGNMETPANALDYSENGMGLIVHQHISIRLEEHIGVNWSVYGKDLESSATIRWLRQDNKYTRMGIELHPDNDTHQELQHMLARTQHSILARLKMKGVPDILL